MSYDFEIWSRVYDFPEDLSPIMTVNPVEILIPGTIENYEFKIEKLWNSETGEEIDTVNPGKAGQSVKLKLPKSTWI